MFTAPARMHSECQHVGTRVRYAVCMKRCGRCGELKVIDDFGFRNKAEARRHNVCRACQAVYRAAYVERVGIRAHHRRIIDWNAAMRVARRAAVLRYLVEHPCVDCGESDVLVLEFDHVRGVKRAAISAMVRDLRPIDEIWTEVAKCDVRCANCHRRKTARTLWMPKHDAQKGIFKTT